MDIVLSAMGMFWSTNQIATAIHGEIYRKLRFSDFSDSQARDEQYLASCDNGISRDSIFVPLVSYYQIGCLI